MANTLSYNAQNNFATVSVSNDKDQAGAQVTKILIPDSGSMDTQYC